MNVRKLGTIEVSPVGMGCMGFSHGYGEIPGREYSIEAIRKAYDLDAPFSIPPRPMAQTCCPKTGDTTSASSAKRFMISAKRSFWQQSCT